MESFKTILVKLASATSFILGTNIMYAGTLGVVGGIILYFAGYMLMEKYKEMN